ncbi:heterokaryon incompatibility protein-domain-containing protein [Bisporella sp. PMI_857]|nr:heterokaryon incompatibility protein-domain-containing protein [Bisporella sp. PMI_857]
MRDCWICYKFSRWLDAENPEIFNAWCTSSLEVEYSFFGRVVFEEPGPDNVLLPFFISIAPASYDGDSLGCDIELNFIHPQDSAKYVIEKPRCHSSNSINFNLVHTWIDRCTREHKKCNRNDTISWFPTRLLHLGSQGQEVKLIISKDTPPNSPYMTLSHRWGPQSYTQLKRSTLVQLQNAIDVVSLPQVFQDTIRIACGLDIHYLWIDALCIMQDQDDLSDWKAESQMMSKVYSSAILNLSATLSLDGSESLFQERSWDAILPSEMTLEVNGLLQKYYVADGEIWDDEIAKAPLNQRGWVFQERFLARRVLHFGKRQLGWECKELEALEIFPNGLPPASAMSFLRKPDINVIMETVTQRSDLSFNKDFVQQWQDLVSAYSKCHLTVSEDKLVAFSGVAGSLMSTQADHYLAGMWESSLIYDLAWWRSSTDREDFPISTTSSRAPSWSWASVDGEISFPEIFGGIKESFARIQELSDPVRDRSSTFAPHGSVRIVGFCLPLSIGWLDHAEMASLKVAGFRFSINDGPLISSVDLEASRQEIQELVQRGNLILMPLFATSYFLHTILLTKVRGLGIHRRLGAVRIEIMKSSDAFGIGSNYQSGQVTEAATSQSQGKVCWNKPALGLIHYLLKGRTSSRTIDII